MNCLKLNPPVLIPAYLFLLSAMGLSEPNPVAVSLSALMPLPTRYAFTASALFCESFLFNAALPVLSVCPSIAIFTSGWSASIWAPLSSSFRAPAVNTAFPVANCTLLALKLYCCSVGSRHFQEYQVHLDIYPSHH